jgi:Rrf2 family protein
MLLNLTAVYGLRAMAVLAALAPGASINAKALAERTAVPQQYLSKVMRKLVVAKLVRSQRGHGGGFALLREPSRIRMVDLLQALDLDIERRCAFGFAACDDKQPCALHPLWSRLQQGLAAWTTECTLGDLGRLPAKNRSR